MDFIGHVAALRPGWGLAPSGRPRGQGCLERGHRRLVRELKKRFCLLDLESSARRCCSSWGWGTDGGGAGQGSVGVGRASCQGSQFPALSPREISAQTIPFPLKPQNASPDMARASSEPQEPRLKSWYPQDPLPQIPGGLSPQPWEPIYPNLDAGGTPNTFTGLLYPAPWAPSAQS